MKTAASPFREGTKNFLLFWDFGQGVPADLIDLGPLSPAKSSAYAELVPMRTSSLATNYPHAWASSAPTCWSLSFGTRSRELNIRYNLPSNSYLLQSTCQIFFAVLSYNLPSNSYLLQYKSIRYPILCCYNLPSNSYLLQSTTSTRLLSGRYNLPSNSYLLQLVGENIPNQVSYNLPSNSYLLQCEWVSKP